MARGHSGLTPTEDAVMALWDAGRGDRAIALELGLTRKRVAGIVQLYCSDTRRADNAAIAAGSAALLAALKREARVLA